MKETCRKSKRPPRRFAAADKCRAVLTLWTERRSVSELCREMGVTWNVLNQWQELAMEGMLHALEPKRLIPRGQVPLNTRLQGLLERKAARVVLTELSEAKPTLSPSPAKRSATTPRTADAPGVATALEAMAQKPGKPA